MTLERRDVNLFPDEGGYTPRQAWQVIESARRQHLTGELSLDVDPPARLYLRDGEVYFAERTTDGALSVRLLVEGVLTRDQMNRGKVVVNGVEHLGRLFDNDDTVDRQSVELCVELFTEDVLTSVATEVARGYQMAMYKKHPNGVDRWFPVSNTVVLHTVEPSPVAPVAAATPAPVIEVASEPEPQIVDDADVEIEAAADVEAGAEVEAQAEEALPSLPATPPRWLEPEPTREMPMEDLDRLVAEATLPRLTPVDEIAAEPVIEHASEPEIVVVTDDAGVTDDDGPASAEAVEVEFEVEAIAAPVDDFSDGIDTSSLADEVAEAVRRALEAIDAAARPPAALRPEDIIGSDEDVRADSASA